MNNTVKHSFQRHAPAAGPFNRTNLNHNWPIGRDEIVAHLSRKMMEDPLLNISDIQEGEQNLRETIQNLRVATQKLQKNNTTPDDKRYVISLGTGIVMGAMNYEKISWEYTPREKGLLKRKTSPNMHIAFDQFSGLSEIDHLRPMAHRIMEGRSRFMGELGCKLSLPEAIMTTIGIDQAHNLERFLPETLRDAALINGRQGPGE